MHTRRCKQAHELRPSPQFRTKTPCSGTSLWKMKPLTAPLEIRQSGILASDWTSRTHSVTGFPNGAGRRLENPGRTAARSTPPWFDAHLFCRPHLRLSSQQTENLRGRDDPPAIRDSDSRRRTPPHSALQTPLENPPTARSDPTAVLTSAPTAGLTLRSLARARRPHEPRAVPPSGEGSGQAHLGEGGAPVQPRARGEHKGEAGAAALTSGRTA